MRKFLCLFALLPSLAFAAAATWAPVSTTAKCSTNGVTSNASCRSVKATCASGTCDAPTTSAQGMSLDSVATIRVKVCADSGQTITGGSSVILYTYDADGVWSKWTTVTVATGSRCAEAEGNSPGLGIPVLGSRGRLAAVVSGVTVSSGGTTTYVYASGAAGQAL